MSGRGKGDTTHIMFPKARVVHDDLDGPTLVSIPAPVEAEATIHPPVEVEIVTESSYVASRKTWRAVELWTKTRVYAIDSRFRCFEVLDRETGKPAVGHPVLGGTLGGGRKRDKKMLEFSYPFPVPGTTAMFTMGKKHAYTSRIERVVIRIRVLRTPEDNSEENWESVLSHWSKEGDG